MSSPVEKSNVLWPLNFSNESPVLPTNSKTNLKCLLCSKVSEFPAEKDEYLAHLFLIHRLVISDEKQIAFLDEYLSYWHEQFNDKNVTNPLEKYCTTMLLNHLPDGTPAVNEKYYLLCEVLPQDYEIRYKLHMKRLQQVLTRHQFERSDHTYERECLHCREIVRPTRKAFIEHLFEKHFLLLGKAENLVFIDELIENVQDKLNQLICLFCNKKFKDRPTLKEHMRKKGHKRIHPGNKEYDRFFLVNYKDEMEKNYTEKQSVQEMFNCTNVNTSPSLELYDDLDWSDWTEERQKITCLFCSSIDSDYRNIKKHMIAAHDVDFDEATNELNFYDRVKIVNYVRRQMYLLKCVLCNEKFETSELLQEHLVSMKHYGVGMKSDWDKPEYFFPTYEDDAMLFDLDDDNNYTNDVVITSEDINIDCVNLYAEQLRKEDFLDLN